MRCPYALSLLLLASVALCQDPASPEAHVEIVHRIWPRGEHQAPAWTSRGSIRLSDPPIMEPSSFSASQASLNSLYQLAIRQRDGQAAPGSMVSVPACRFIGNSLNDTITLVLDNADPANIVHLSYHTSAKTWSCERAKGSDDASVHIRASGTAVRLQIVQTPDPPRLHQPAVVQLNQDGSVRQPEKEKTFIQKYWMWIIPLLLFTVFAPSDPNAARGGGAAAAAPAR